MMPWLEEFLTNMVGDIVSGEPVSVEDMAAHVRRYAPGGRGAADPRPTRPVGRGIRHRRSTARLRIAIPNSSIPDAISAIVGGLTDNNAALGAPSLDHCPECGRRITDFDMSGCRNGLLNGGIVSRTCPTITPKPTSRRVERVGDELDRLQ